MGDTGESVRISALAVVNAFGDIRDREHSLHHRSRTCGASSSPAITTAFTTHVVPNRSATGDRALLILDDLGMRKLPLTAAEELLEMGPGQEE